VNLFPLTEDQLPLAEAFSSALFGTLERIPARPDSDSRPFECHEAAVRHGEPISGHYVFSDNSGILHAERHVISLVDGEFVDFSAQFVTCPYIWFIFSNETHDSLMYSQNSVSYKYTYTKLESKDMYYVYALIDPRNNEPFYIGKGSGKRAWDHLRIVVEGNDFKQNKINSIRSQGLEPLVRFFVSDIEDEKTAYAIEKIYIKKYGRKKDGGILTNICIDARPPSMKGRTYEDILGTERAAARKKLTSDLQKDGGFGPSRHSEISKRRISESGKRHQDKLLQESMSSETIITIARDFAKFFDGKISNKKWLWYAKQINISAAAPRRLNRDNIGWLQFTTKTTGAKVVNDSLLWFHDSATKKGMRCFDWEFEMKIKPIPKSYIRGRGVCTNRRVNKDVTATSFKGFSL
jgi:hypothetical protein